MRLRFRLGFAAAIQIAEYGRQLGAIVVIERSHWPTRRADRPADNVETGVGDADMGFRANEFAKRE